MSDTDPTVLVCHSDPSMRRAYERTLADSGFRVRMADRPSAVPPLPETDVRAVVLSLETAGLSAEPLPGGLEATHARVALLVPFGESAPASGALPDRVDECLAEPVPDEDLVAAVERLLARADYDARLRRCFDLAREVAAAEADPTTDPSEVDRLRTRLRRLRSDLGESSDGLGEIDRFAVAAEPDA